MRKSSVDYLTNLNPLKKHLYQYNMLHFDLAEYPRPSSDPSSRVLTIPSVAVAPSKKNESLHDVVGNYYIHFRSQS